MQPDSSCVCADDAFLMHQQASRSAQAWPCKTCSAVLRPLGVSPMLRQQCNLPDRQQKPATAAR